MLYKLIFIVELCYLAQYQETVPKYAPTPAVKPIASAPQKVTRKEPLNQAGAAGISG